MEGGRGGGITPFRLLAHLQKTLHFVAEKWQRLPKLYEKGGQSGDTQKDCQFLGGLPYWIIHRVVPLPFRKSIAAAILLFWIIYGPQRAIWWDLCLTLRFANRYLIRTVGIHKECLIFYQNVFYCESVSFWWDKVNSKHMLLKFQLQYSFDSSLEMWNSEKTTCENSPGVVLHVKEQIVYLPMKSIQRLHV